MFKTWEQYQAEIYKKHYTAQEARAWINKINKKQSECDKLDKGITKAFERNDGDLAISLMFKWFDTYEHIIRLYKMG